MTQVAAGRVAVSVIAGSRRSDVTLLDGVPLAELVPDLASLCGVAPDGRATLVTLDGRRLDPALGLRAQGIRDGAMLVVGQAAPPPVRYDDPAIEVASSSLSAGSMAGTTTAGLASAVVGAALGGAGVAVLAAASRRWPETALLWPGVLVVCAVGYAAVPVWAGHRALVGPGPEGVDGVRRWTRAAYLALATVVVATAAHAALVAAVLGVALMLRARHHRDPVSAATVGGAGWLAVATAVASASARVSALGAVGGGATVLLALRLTRPDADGWWWAADILERLALAAAPLAAVVMAGLVPRVGR